MTVKRLIAFVPIFLLSCIIKPIQYSFTCLFILIALPFGYISMPGVVRFFVRFIARGNFVIAGKILHIHGLEHIRNDNNYLLISNHSSYYDVPAIMSFAPMPAWLGHARFLKIPVFSSLLRFIHFIPVYKGDAVKSKKAIDIAISKSKNIAIAIFPEGTRSPDGKMHDFKKGFVHIFRGTELDILPITLNGFYTFGPRHRWAINPFARLEVIVHKPIPRNTLADKSNDEIIEFVRAKIASVYTDQIDWVFPTPSVLRKQRIQSRVRLNHFRKGI